MKPKRVADYIAVATILVVIYATVFPVFTVCRESPRYSSFRNLRQVGLALTMYMQDCDERLPPLRNAASVQKLLDPYLKNDAVWREPKTGRAYAVNRALSGQKLARFAKSADRTVVVYETLPDNYGYRGVTFLDGHARRVNRTTWAELKTGSKIATTSAECLAALRAADERESRLRLPVLERRVNGWDALVFVVQVLLPALFWRVFAPRRRTARP